MAPMIEIAGFGTPPGGAAARLFTLDNGVLRVAVTDFGARMANIEAPDRAGARAPVLLGLRDAAEYAADTESFGAVLGRCANRIAGARFALGGGMHRLAANDRGATLHGGPRGFGDQPWRLEDRADRPRPAVAFALRSPDGDQGFPGAVTARATYALDGDTLWLTLEARADADTVVNLSAHPYFNLRDAGRGDVLGHEIAIRAARFVAVDDKQIPTGELRSVEGTPFDFRQSVPLGARIALDDPQLRAGRGYDTCFVLDGGEADQPRAVAAAYDPASGRRLELLTTQPGLQLYSGNALDGSVIGREGLAYRQSAGFAFEAQGLPDAIHHPNFPSPLLRAGVGYRQAIGYRFGIG